MLHSVVESPSEEMYKTLKKKKRKGKKEKEDLMIEPESGERNCEDRRNGNDGGL